MYLQGANLSPGQFPHSRDPAAPMPQGVAGRD